ncbi:hypothetical protein AD929_15680 [Gluconobacter potus]|uniref:Phage protein n=1 Tax=Gluconobacter potus TaxID=2724927 RepID=A0A149QPK9_9PROT|nr:hypothetical protein [Gluconobacter potus]KXU99235.1 hypothetical protein AD929_15680 [Gluconobacter potus]
MSDIGTVANGLRDFVASVLYPNGDSNASIAGDRVIVQRGWLTTANLTGACGLQSGTGYVTIVALEGGYKRIGEGLGMPWKGGTAIPATVGISAVGNVVTVTAPSSGVTGIVGIRMMQNGQSHVASYAATSTDTAATIASALAAQITGATVSGTALTIPAGLQVAVASTGHVTASRLTRRQQQTFQVTLWTNSPGKRDSIALALDSGMSGTPWFPDNTGAQCLLRFSGSSDVDTQQSSSIFRRVFRMTVVFDTTQEQQQAQMLFGGMSVTANDGQVLHYGDQPLF